MSNTFDFILGTFCETEINYCASFPCMNEGSCSNVILSSPSFDKNETVRNNSSRSEMENKTFLCNCPPEYYGSQCEVSKISFLNILTTLDIRAIYYKIILFCALHLLQWDVDECLVSPCLNGGYCFNGFGSFECVCLEGFKGKNNENYLESLQTRFILF